MAQIPDYTIRQVNGAFALSSHHRFSSFIYQSGIYMYIDKMLSVAPRNMKRKQPQWDLNQEPMDCWCHADHH